MKRFLIYTLMITVLLLAVPAGAIQTGSISDPMSIGVGARSLGMGRAYVAVAEGGEAVFVNPAGLALS